MAGRCKGSTTFMNIIQPCEHEAYDAEGYCAIHALLIARQRIAELEAAAEKFLENSVLEDGDYLWSYDYEMARRELRSILSRRGE